MDEPTRRSACELAMSVLGGGLHARRLLPLVLLAVDPDDSGRVVVMPAYPGMDPERVRRRLIELTDELRRQGFESVETPDVDV